MDTTRKVTGHDPITEKDWTITSVGLQVQQMNALIPEEFDYIGLTYTNGNLTSVAYKTGGSSGTLQATLTLAYTGSRLDTVTKT